MADSGAESEDESLSPIFGFSYDEEGNAEESRWRIDPHLEVKKNEISTSVQAPERVAETERKLECVEHDNFVALEDKIGVKIGFTTASGKDIKISEKALKEATKKFEAVENEDLSLPEDKMKPLGFTTAGGRDIKISEAALEEAKRRMETIENENFVVPEAKMKPIGFTTASGKDIKISKKALEEAKKKFDAVENEDLTLPEVKMKPKGLTTAAGKDVRISKKDIQEAKTEFDPVENEDLTLWEDKMQRMGFTTASGKDIKISRKALLEAKKKFDAVENEELTSPEVKTNPIGFTTAAGKNIKISEKALEEAKKKFDLVENEDLFPPEVKTNPIGFTTAAGKNIKISEKALLEAKKKFDAVENEDLTLPEIKTNPIGFTTAAGKNINISEKALEEAKRKFDLVENEDLNLPGVKLNPIGFTTAAGKDIKISEKALEEATKKFKAAENEYLTLPEVKTKSIGGTTASGKDADISERASGGGELKVQRNQKRNDCEKSLNVSCISDVFDFGQTSPVVSPEQSNEIEDLTLSLLMDVSTNDESDWDNNDNQTTAATDSLAAIPSDVEIIPLLKAVVVRVYPIVYCIKLAGSNLFLSEKAYLFRQMTSESKKEELRENLLPEIENKIRKNHFSKKMSTFSKTPLKDMSVDDILVYLNSAEDGSSAHIMNELSLSKKEEVEKARIKIEDKIRGEVEEEFTKQLKSLELESRASPVYKLRVVDIGPYQKEDFKNRGGSISIWNPNLEMVNAIKENEIYEFHSLKQSMLQTSSDKRLSTTKGTKIHPTEEILTKSSFARKLTTIQQVLSGNFFPPFEEFDTVGLIIEVSSYTTSSGQMIRISDQWNNILKIKFWNSLKDAGIDDLLKVGTFIACLNLQWRQSSAKTGMAFAQDVSCFHTNTKVEHLLQGYQDLCSALKECMPKFDGHAANSKNQDIVQKLPESKKEDAESSLEQSKIRASIKRRYLEQYGDPPELPPMHSPAKRGRVSKKFVVPRRIDSKPPS